REYERVGDATPRTVDIRLIAATNRDLDADVRAGRFREDLLYRLNVIEVTVPPLRNRRKDILPLARRLLVFFARQVAKPVTGFSPEAEATLEGHRWPGNVRELRNAIERGVILCPGSTVDVSHLPGHLSRPAGQHFEVGGTVTLDDLERE